MNPENLQIHLAHIVLKKIFTNYILAKKISFSVALFTWNAQLLLFVHAHYYTTTLYVYDYSIHSCYE